MADTFELLSSCPDKTAVVHVAITGVISNLWVIMEMLPPGSEKVASAIKECRDDLCRIRGQVDTVLTTRAP